METFQGQMCAEAHRQWKSVEVQAPLCERGMVATPLDERDASGSRTKNARLLRVLHQERLMGGGCSIWSVH